MDIQSDSALEKVCQLIESCRLQEAAQFLDETLPSDLDNDELFFTANSCRYWHNALENLSALDVFEQGETIINTWKGYTAFIERQKTVSEKAVYSFRKGFFSLALEKYSAAPDEQDPALIAEICRKKGLCYKKLGSYESALKCLTEANAALEGQASIIAEMADCWALCGEEKNAKLLFKEAFYIDAQKIDFSFLDSKMINLLIKEVESKGYSGAALQEWVPVYAVIMGIFTYRRLLRSNEVLRLKQGIYALESELKNPTNDAEVLTPKLLNRYFWLIDYYKSVKESAPKIDEVLLHIRIHDTGIYNSYRKAYF
ncbi:MAG: hypothetical protein J5780_05070 [Treponema sp.]|nr:hypothetical protein [Treponema sp.]